MGLIKTISGFVLTGLLLTVIQQPFGVSSLAWVALLPIILLSSPKIKVSRLWLFGYLACSAYWFGNLYWLAWPTTIGYIIFCIYMGIYWPILAVCVRYCRMRKLPLVIMIPILLVGAEAWQGWILGGFSWRLLGHSQHQNTALIQIADIFGVGGISFLIAMVNGLIADFALTRKRIIPKAITVAVLIALTILYGNFRISQTDKLNAGQSPLLASVQTNEPLTTEGLGYKSDLIFDDLMNISRDCAKADAKLIIWPETMVLETLEQEYLELRGSAYRGFTFDAVITNFAQQNNVCVVVGATGGRTQLDGNMVSLHDRTNAAYVYLPNGTQDKNRYDKIHLIPFGEVVPFKYSAPWLYKFLLKLTPYPDDANFSMTRGEKFFVYDIQNGEQNFKFGIIICYEDTLAWLVRKMVVDKSAGKRIDCLVNISNDGWFTRKRQGGNRSSTELVQHAVICSFRAIENRVSIIRSVNTGVSCFIDSAGRIRDGYIAGNLPDIALARICVPGWFTDRADIDTRITIFSRAGAWLDYLCAIASAAMIVIFCTGKKSIKAWSASDTIE